MNMEGSIINSWGVDPGYIILGMVIIILILFITVIVSLIKMSQLYRRYDIFMRGKDAETLEDLLINQIEDINLLKIEDMTNKSKGDYAYTLLDIDTPVTAEVVGQLQAITGVLRVRVVK